ncbi:MAG: hypothetical protein FWG12_01170 [Holophagaceae bacterium]|nr:hypothetical protein [Holophagaceae bacterium]
MKAHKLLCAGAAFAMLGAYAQAQEGYSYAFKFKAGLTAGDIQTTHFDNKLFGFGVEVRKDMFGPDKALTAELAWEFVPGRHYNVMKPLQGEDLDIFRNFDARKEYGQGFSCKAAYNAPLSIPNFPYLGDLEWFGGISLDMYSVRSEIEFTIFHPSAPGDWPAGTADTAKYQGDSFVEQGMTLVPGVFAGLRFQLGRGTFGEVSLRNFGMRHHEYTPGIYFGSATGKMESGTSRGWSCEFALSVKI